MQGRVLAEPWPRRLDVKARCNLDVKPRPLDARLHPSMLVFVCDHPRLHLGARRSTLDYPSNPRRTPSTEPSNPRRGGARNNSRFHTRTACMLELDIDYRSQCVAHALQVREFHSMLGRGARTSTFRVRVIQLGLGYTRDTTFSQLS